MSYGPQDGQATDGLPRHASLTPEWWVRRRNLIVPLILLGVAAILVSTGTILWFTGQLDVKDVGFPAVWLISFFGAAAIVVPVPGIAVVAAAPQVGLNPLAVGIVAGSAEALGELTGYFAGASGRGLARRNRHYRRLRVIMARRGGILIFIGSVIPNPFFDILGIAAGSLGYPIRKFLPITFAGKAIKSTLIAYGSFYSFGGVEWLVRVLS